MDENLNYSDLGGLLVSATTLKWLYPVPGAVVTVFTGPNNNRQIIATDITDQSGKTKVFSLPAPAKALSETEGSAQNPYASYNISVKADGYIEHINLNVPIFSGVTSLQNADLVLISAAGDNLSARIYDEIRNYNL